MNIMLKGGIVVSSSGTEKADVRIDGETIAEVGKDLPVYDELVIDMKGKLLFQDLSMHTPILIFM